MLSGKGTYTDGPKTLQLLQFVHTPSQENVVIWDTNVCLGRKVSSRALL